ncbi:hypothetical protein DRQ18_01605 [bacterium]|nr:MAG: hypothetical protein DRQ18_01605 [bacterium]
MKRFVTILLIPVVIHAGEAWLEDFHRFQKKLERTVSSVIDSLSTLSEKWLKAEKDLETLSSVEPEDEESRYAIAKEKIRLARELFSLQSRFYEKVGKMLEPVREELDALIGEMEPVEPVNEEWGEEIKRLEEEKKTAEEVIRDLKHINPDEMVERIKKGYEAIYAFLDEIMQRIKGDKAPETLVKIKENLLQVSLQLDIMATYARGMAMYVSHKENLYEILEKLVDMKHFMNRVNAELSRVRTFIPTTAEEMVEKTEKELGKIDKMDREIQEDVIDFLEE